MKKVLIILVSLFAIMSASTGLKAQEVTILLRPGWNWIGYPYPESVDLENAFVDFEPMNDDVIQSFWGYSEYATGSGWFGEINELQPGWGYMYYSNRTEEVSVVLSAPVPQPLVTTNEPTDIATESAVCGGNVASVEGSYVLVMLKGVCWGVNSNPTINDNFALAGSGMGDFSVSMTGLTPATTYYVRAFAITAAGTLYGNEVSFESFALHDCVDLGLPSGTLWATRNVGADTPEEYGYYFAWGETQPKEYYDWSTYQYCNGASNQLTKYCNNFFFGNNGFTDTLTVLLPEDDAAMANWGPDWRMPTKEEWQELYQNTTCTWTTQNGVEGELFTASNGNSLFLPAAGLIYPDVLNGAGSYGDYFSSTLCMNDRPYDVWHISFNSDYCNVDDYGSRCVGASVRAVRSPLQNNVPTGAIDGKFTVNEEGGQVYFSQGNLQYIGSASTPYWKFAENQWDYIGDTPEQNSTNQDADRDIFGWGTSGYDHGAVCYQPWSTSTTYSDYYVYGSYSYNLYDQTGQADWGYNPISNGGYQENQWRTLTTQEWQYVFETRSTPSGIRYAKAKVNDVNGVILLPDDWSSDIYSLSNINSSDASYNSNTISANQWITFEDAGAVFLPASGSRNGTSVSLVGDYGNYWSSSHNYLIGARYVSFYDTFLNANVYSYRNDGYAVRLARDVE